MPSPPAAALAETNTVGEPSGISDANSPGGQGTPTGRHPSSPGKCPAGTRRELRGSRRGGSTLAHTPSCSIDRRERRGQTPAGPRFVARFMSKANKKRKSATHTERYEGFVEHPRYWRGPIVTGLDVATGWIHRGHIPGTAIKADVSKQNCSTMGVSHYYDLERRCDRCERSFIFFAEEQRVRNSGSRPVLSRRRDERSRRRSHRRQYALRHPSLNPESSLRCPASAPLGAGAPC